MIVFLPLIHLQKDYLHQSVMYSLTQTLHVNCTAYMDLYMSLISIMILHKWYSQIKTHIIT